MCVLISASNCEGEESDNQAKKKLCLFTRLIVHLFSSHKVNAKLKVLPSKISPMSHCR